MSITVSSNGAAAYGTTTLAISDPGATVGQLILVPVGVKPASATVVTPTGWGGNWVRLNDSVGTTGSNAADTGPTRLVVFAKVADGTESGTLGITLTSGNTSWGTSFLFNSSNAGKFSIETAIGEDTSNGTGFSATCTPGGSVPAGWIKPGDLLLGLSCKPTDLNSYNSENFASTGLTIGSRTKLREYSTANGNDIGGESWWANVTSGTQSSATVTASATMTGSSYGPAMVIRIRDTLPSPITALPFSENTGSMAHDVSGNAFDVPVTGTWTGSGKNGSGINGPNITASGQTFEIGFDDYPVGRTIMCWTKLNNFPPTNSNADIWSDTDADLEEYFYWGTASNGTTHSLEYGWYYPDFSNSGSLYLTFPVATATWYHTTLTTFPGGQSRLIINAVVADTGTSPALGFMETNDSKLGKTLDGTMDDFRIFDEVLSVWDIAYYMVTPVASHTTINPISAYNFDEGSGTTAHDFASGSYDITTRSTLWDTGHTSGGMKVLSSTGSSGISTTRQDFGPSGGIVSRTVMCWMRIEATMTNGQGFGVFDRELVDSGASDDTSYVTKDSGGNTRFGYYWTDGVNELYPEWIYDFVPHTWYHVAIVNAPRSIKLYVDGEHSFDLDPAYYDGDYALTSKGTIGLNDALIASESDTSVTIDDLRVFDRALSSYEITNYMNTPVTGSIASNWYLSSGASVTPHVLTGGGLVELE
jgi:hypothetical protein